MHHKTTTELDGKIDKSTKRKIKDITAKLVRQIETINRKKIKDWIENHRFERAPKITLDADTDTRGLAQVREIGTQTEDEGKLSELGLYDSYSEWKIDAEKEWNDELFTNTQVVQGSLNESVQERNKDSMGKLQRRQHGQRHPKSI